MRISEERYNKLSESLTPKELEQFDSIKLTEKTIKIGEAPKPYNNGECIDRRQLNPIGDKTGVYNDGFGNYMVILSFKYVEDAQLFSGEIFK